MEHRQVNAPLVGETAPPFQLITADGKRTVKLSDLHEKTPVVLIFTSWGCDIFRQSLDGLESLHEQYCDRIDFRMIYIREAHPYDGFGAHLGRTFDAKTTADRMTTALDCHKQLRLPFPILIDPIDDPATTRWGAWPVRIYVIGTNGKVEFAGPQGPWGYRPYRGFVHGNGTLSGRDLRYSQASLEEFLELRFSTKRVKKSGD